MLNNKKLVEETEIKNKFYIDKFLEKINTKFLRMYLMNNADLISVIMSTYNNEKSIESSVNSILNQTYKILKFLIIEYFSTDNTYEILNNLKNTDERLNL